MEIETGNNIGGNKKMARPTTGRPTTAKNISNTNATNQNNMNIINPTQNRLFKYPEEEDLKGIEEESISVKKLDLIPIPVNSRLNSLPSNELTNPYETFNNQNYQHSELERIIKEENELAEFLNKQKRKLKAIDLIEKNIEGLYDWKSLFSKSKSITAYTCTNIKYDHYLYEEEKTQTRVDTGNAMNLNNVNKTSNENLLCFTKENVTSITKEATKAEKPFRFPIALIDEKEEVINEYISQRTSAEKRKKKSRNAKWKLIKKRENKTIKSNNNSFSTGVHSNKIQTGVKSNAARPQSVYAVRNDNAVYYLDKAFSQYFTQEESEFVEKFPLLHPKVKCRPKSLKKTLNEVKFTTIRHDDIVNKRKCFDDEDIKLGQKELNLAGNSKNPVPLLKSVYKQIYPEITDEPLPSNKLYLISNKPLDGKNEDIDFYKNVRNKNMTRLYSANSEHNRINSAKNKSLRNNSELNLEMYNEDDPEIKIFEEKVGEVCLDKIEENAEDKVEEKSQEKKDEKKIGGKIEDNKQIDNERLNTIEKLPELLDSNYSLEENDILNELENFKIIEKKQMANKYQNERPKTAINCSTETTMFRNLKTKPYTAKHKNNPNSSVGVGTENKTNEITTYNRPTLDYISNKSLPIKGKPTHPYAYQKMKNALKISDGVPTKCFFDDAVKIKNVQENIREDFNEYFESTDKSFPQRPKTSTDFVRMKGPVNKAMDKDTINLDSHRVTTSKANLKANTKNKNINNIYFNEYIDVQFKTNSHLNNFNKKDEATYLIKKQNLTKNSRTGGGEEALRDLLIISNLQFNHFNETKVNKVRNIKSARVTK